MSKYKKRRSGRPAQTVATNTAPAGTKVMTMDAIVNQLARLGTPDALLQQNRVGSNRLTSAYSVLDVMYRADWIARKVVDIIPQDGTKNWYELTCQVEPDKAKELDTVERKTHVRERILEGARLGRLYGGAAGIIVVSGQEDMLDEPLNLDMVFSGSFRGIIIADRWNGVNPSTDLVTDLDDPDFGLPEYYTFSLPDTELEQGIKVHHSRVLRFTGRYLPYNERMVENMWGMSELEHVYEELNKRNTTSANIAQLIFSAQLRVLKMGDLGQMLALTDPQTQRDLYATIAAQNELMNNMSIQLLDKDDDFQTFQYTFSGLSDVYEQFMNDISGAAEIPATRLFGRSPQGMNSTGESDMRTYYDTVHQWQEAHLRPALEKLLPVVCMSAWGEIPDDLGMDFAPIRDTSDEERASMIQQTAGAINTVFGSGIISQRTALMELRDAGEPLGMWTNITDEDIENADDGTMQEGDMMGGMPGMPGMPGEEGGEDPMAAMMAGGAPGGMPEGPAAGPETPGQPAGPAPMPNKGAETPATAPQPQMMNVNPSATKTPDEAQQTEINPMQEKETGRLDPESKSLIRALAAAILRKKKPQETEVR